MANNTIATAYVQIQPSMQGITGSLEKELGVEGQAAGSAFSGGFTSMIGPGLLGAAGVAAGALTAVTGATASASKALIDGVSNLATYGDNIDKMSQKMGISAKGYQEWEAVMQHSGTSMETMKASMKTLANAVENNNGAFERIGLTIEDISKMSNEDLFGAVINGLQQVDNETERTYLAGQLLGRGATELGALLNSTAEETQAMKDRVAELGGVLSDDAVKNSAAFQDSLQDMITGFDGVKNKLLADFLPSMKQVMDGVTDIFAGDTDAGLENIQKGIEETVNQVTTLIPRFTEIAAPILTTLGEALITNIPLVLPAIGEFISQLGMAFAEYAPKLIKVGADVLVIMMQGLTDAMPVISATIPGLIQSLSQAFFENAPALAEAFYTLLEAASQGLIEAYPQIIAMAPELISQYIELLLTTGLPLCIDAMFQIAQAMITGIIENIPLFISTGIDVIKALAQGLIDGIPNVLSSLMTIRDSIDSKVKEIVTQALTWGADLVGKFVEGIRKAIPNLRGAVSDMANTIKSYLHFSEPDVGPLADFSTYAPDMMKLFAQGIKDNEDVVTAQIQSSFDFGNQIKEQNANVIDTAMSSPAYAPTESVVAVDTQNNEALSGQFAQAVELLGQLVDKDPVEIGADATGIFNLVRRENSIYKRANGMGALA